MKVQRRGFTLVEMLMVVAFMAVLLGLIMVNGNTARAKREADQAALELEGALRYARSSSLNNSGSRLAFSAAGVQPMTWSVLPGPTGGSAVRTGTIPASVQVSVAPSATVIPFNANGSTTQAWTITVASQATSRTTVITIGQQTGAIVATRTQS